MILIGNIISLAAACFMAASCISRDNRHVFLFQGLECALLAIASVFFHSYAAVSTMLLSAIRNFIVAKGRYTKPVMFGFVLVTTIIGVWINTRGFLGLLPVLATAEYAICCYYIRKTLATKYSIFFNVLIWVVYSFLIFDFSTAISDSILLILDLIVIVRMHREKRTMDNPAPTRQTQTDPS